MITAGRENVIQVYNYSNLSKSLRKSCAWKAGEERHRSGRTESLDRDAYHRRATIGLVGKSGPNTQYFRNLVHWLSLKPLLIPELMRLIKVSYTCRGIGMSSRGPLGRTGERHYAGPDIKPSESDLRFMPVALFTDPCRMIVYVRNGGLVRRPIRETQGDSSTGSNSKNTISGELL